LGDGGDAPTAAVEAAVYDVDLRTGGGQPECGAEEGETGDGARQAADSGTNEGRGEGEERQRIHGGGEDG
jgi:hypothetical protein